MEWSKRSKHEVELQTPGYEVASQMMFDLRFICTSFGYLHHLCRKEAHVILSSRRAETKQAMDLAGAAVEREMDAQSSVSAAKAAFLDVEKLVEQATERIALYKSAKKVKGDGDVVEVQIRPEDEEEAAKAVKAIQEAIVESPNVLAVAETAAKAIEAKAVAVVEQEVSRELVANIMNRPCMCGREGQELSPAVSVLLIFWNLQEYFTL